MTIQSKSIASLPLRVQKALLQADGYTEIWPLGRDSPFELGHPKNFRISDIEDRLFELARNMGIKLRPGQYSDNHTDINQYDVLAICEGAGSKTRENFNDKFGTGDPGPYSINSQHIQDSVLGLKVDTRIESSLAVVLTVMQNRFLLNIDQHGRGYLNMRLTEQEARKFKQANNPTLGLWTQIFEGMKLFDANVNQLHEITRFDLSMKHRSRFTVELSRGRSGKQTFGCLLGDAANSMHFWPGRGLNQGLLSALSLAHSLYECRIQEKGIREADLSRHEGIMHMLQHRYKSRAWSAMVRKSGEHSQTIHSLLTEGYNNTDMARGEMILILRNRVQNILKRLQGRLPDLPGENEIMQKINRLGDMTLRGFVTGDAWETHYSGGPEVDIGMFYPHINV